MSSRRSNLSTLQMSCRNSQSSRSNLGGSTSKRNVAFEQKVEKNTASKKNTVKIFDENGVDVTPKPLYNPDLLHSNNSQSRTGINLNDSSSVSTPSDFNQSMFGASQFQSSYAAGFSRSIMSSMMGSSRASLDSVAGDLISTNTSDAHHGLLDHTETAGGEVEEVFDEQNLKKMITINLVETDTIWHLDIPGVTVSIEDSHEVWKRNEQYNLLCDNRVGNDMYVERAAQTFNDGYKTKEVQTMPITYQDENCEASTWEMYDTYNELNAKKDIEEDEEEEMLGQVTTTITKSKDGDLMEASVVNSVYASTQATQSLFEESRTGAESALSGNTLPDTVSTITSPESDEMDKLIKDGSLKDTLFFIERMVVQNLYQDRQAGYRGLEDLSFSTPLSEQPSTADDNTADADDDLEEPLVTKIGANLARLWSYECAQAKGMRVNAMVWNKNNSDLLGVGYGCTVNADQQKGLVCVWSVKNPEFPERLYTQKSMVTSIDFSTSHPNFLAVGLYNGSIVVYNIRSAEDKPVLDSIESEGKHEAPVWQLKWIERDKGTGEERSEVLVSVSGDGRITQWSIRKGFEYIDLMKIKRMSCGETNKGKKQEGKKSDALISRLAAGMCFDFHPQDNNTYIIGTEEGLLHRCSCSYNEQFLETYTGHKGPVYRTAWSPFEPSIFMTCSTDWTIRIWNAEQQTSVLTLQSATKGYVDIDWSPMTPVMFAAINDHQIEIWDLSSNVLDPLLINRSSSASSLTAVKFALNSEALLVGDSEGHVTVYQLREMCMSQETSLRSSLTSASQHNSPVIEQPNLTAAET